MKSIYLIFVIFYLCYNFRRTVFVKKEHEMKGTYEFETNDGTPGKLDLKETVQWEPPVDVINGDIILKAEENIKDRPSIPTLFDNEYSMVTTEHNSYYHIDEDKKHYYHNETHTIMGRYCTYENTECRDCKQEYIICLECHKKKISVLNFLEDGFEDYSRKHGYGIEWNFIQSAEIEIPISPNAEFGRIKRKINIWRFRIYNLENSSDFFINDYWEDSKTRTPYRVGYLSTRKITNLHTFETYDYIIIYNFNVGNVCEKIICKTKIQ